MKSTHSKYQKRKSQASFQKCNKTISPWKRVPNICPSSRNRSVQLLLVQCCELVVRGWHDVWSSMSSLLLLMFGGRGGQCDDHRATGGIVDEWIHAHQRRKCNRSSNKIRIWFRSWALVYFSAQPSLSIGSSMIWSNYLFFYLFFKLFCDPKTYDNLWVSLIKCIDID